MTDAENTSSDRAALVDFCLSLGASTPASGAKHHRVQLPNVVLRWESHGEFTTYTWESNACWKHAGSSPFSSPPEPLRGCPDLIPQHGPLMVALDLHLVTDRAGCDAKSVFGSMPIAVAETDGGAALIATDFRPDPRGFVRILVVNKSLTDAQAGALVQRLLEIETYRTLALLGLPEAQRIAPSIRRIELELPDLLQEIRTSEALEDSRHLLFRLTTLAAEVEAGAAASLFRFGATQAYDELIRLRLEAIGERPTGTLPSWSSFLSRRLAPAIRTCASTERRQENLSRKLARAAELLRTRVDIELESQNRDLLRTMGERLRLQLRLQQTVEGLSVAAITYYVSSLFHLLLDGIHSFGIAINATVGTAAFVPVALVGVAWIVRRTRRSHGSSE